MPTQFSDLPEGASIVSVPTQTPSSQTSQSFSDLPEGATVVHVPQPTAQPSTSGQPQSVMERTAQGFGASAAGGLTTAAKIGSKIPGVSWLAEKAGDVMGLPKLPTSTDPYKTVQEGIKPAVQQATSTTAGKVGAVLEGISEFVLGDEALKGLNLAKKLGITAKLAEIAEQSPNVAKALRIGMNALRTGTVGTGQGLAHGETTGEAVRSGVFAGLTGAADETGVEGIKSLAPAVKKIAGEIIPTRASQESKLASAAENVAPSKTLQKFDVERTQPAAKRAIGKVASDVGSKGISGQTLATGAKDLGERAKQIRAQSKPVFEKLDDLTKDQDTKFSDWQKQERSAYRRGDYEAAQKAKAAQENVLETFKDQFDPEDLQNARTNWRQASALDAVHDSLNTKSIVQPTPVAFRPKGAPDPGVLNGKNFSKQILKMRDDGTLAQAGLTPEHIQSLQDLGTLLEKSANVHKFGQLAKLAEFSGAGLTAVLHPATAIAGAKAAPVAFVASRLLGQVMTNPKAADTAVLFLKGVGKVAPPIAAQGSRAIFDGAKDALGGQE